MDTYTVLFFLLFSFFYLIDASKPGNVGSSNAQTSPTCGVAPTRSGIDNRIVGGNVSNIAFHPWFAALAKQENDHYIVACGSTLITSTHLITAAHCYEGGNGQSRESRFLILFNLQNRCKDKGKLARAKQVIIHNKYGKGSDLPENDIAMIVLTEPVSNTPICLPSKATYHNVREDEDDDDGGLIIGYGSTKVRTAETYPCELREAKITIYSKNKCLRTGIGNSFVKKAICAGKIKGQIDACDGDSGGPLMVKEGGRYELIGVTSYGEGCGRKNYPGVYTDLTVNGFAKWIQKKLQETSGNGTQSSGSGQQTAPSNGGQISPQKPSKPLKPINIGFIPPLLPHWIHLLNGAFLPPPPLHHHMPPPPFMDLIDPFQPDLANMVF